MAWKRKSPKSCHDEEGFALVVVLWIAGLLAVLTATLAVSARTQLRVTENVTESAKAEALADVGIALSVIDLLSGRHTRDHPRRFPIDGQTISCSVFGEGSLSISVTDESALIDVNSAGIPIMQALIAGLGIPPEQAAQLAGAIFDYRDSDDVASRNGAESAEYRYAGLAWEPKNGPLQSVEELGQVLGMTPEILSRLRPYIGVHSGRPGIDLGSASEAMIKVLRDGLEGSAGAFGTFPEFHVSVALPAMFVSTSMRRFYSLKVEAKTAGGAVFIREAVVDLGVRNASRYVFLQWTRNVTGQAGSSQARSYGLSPC